MSHDTDILRVLRSIETGDSRASEELLPLVYDELRRLAARQLEQERPGQTLQATALVHEAYVRLLNADDPPTWQTRGHFFSAAAEAMRRILIENARRKNRIKHGGGLKRADVTLEELAGEAPADDLLALDEALARLAVEHPDKAQLVKLRYFAGLSLEEAAQALGISRATASRHWTYSRAWLYDAMQSG